MTPESRSLPIGEFGIQVLPDLYVVSWLGMTAPRIDCHVYVLRGADGLLMIDCGTTWGHQQLLRNMAHWKLDIGAVRTVLCTHSHVDHVSGGYLFKQHGAELLGHREMLTTTEGQWEAQGMLDEQGCAWRLDGTLEDGMRLSRCGFDIEVIATPGHTRGCLSFLITVNGQSCLFSGDLIMTDGYPGWSGDEGHDLTSLVASLERLEQVPFEHLCHGHDVIIHDRGTLFRDALLKHADGAWSYPASRYVQGVVPGRRPADTQNTG